MVATRNRYYMTQPAKINGREIMTTAGVIGGVVGVAIVGMAMPGSGEIDLVEISDNMASILMKVYKEEVHK